MLKWSRVDVWNITDAEVVDSRQVLDITDAELVQRADK